MPVEIKELQIKAVINPAAQDAKRIALPASASDLQKLKEEIVQECMEKIFRELQEKIAR